MQLPMFHTLYRSLLLLLPLQKVPFTYEETLNWHKTNPSCAGYHQSPIALSVEKDCRFIKNHPIIFKNYNTTLRKPFKIQNTGKSVKIDLIDALPHKRKPYIKSQFLDNAYEAVAFHFHWGQEKNKGSEHILNGKRYDLEMHIVHKNKHFKTLSQAANATDGLAALAVLFQSAPGIRSTNMPALDAVFKQLKNIKNCDSSAHTAKAYALFDLLSTVLSQQKPFFHYKGSLTTPPYPESVNWFVFTDIIQISKQVLEDFRKLMNKEGKPMTNNCRDVQCLNDRVVYYHNSYNRNYVY